MLEDESSCLDEAEEAPGLTEGKMGLISIEQNGRQK